MGLKLIGEVGLDGSGFERGLNAMARSVKGFIAGAFGLYAVESMIRKTVDTAKDLETESKRLGIGIVQLQVLKAAAQENSRELETLAKAFERLDVAREKALSGSIEGMRLLGRFAQLGISEQDLHTETAAALFMGPLRGRANSMSPEVLGPILRDVLGKDAGELIGVLQTNFEELEKRLRAMGALMDPATANKLTAMGNAFDRITQIMVSQFGPALLKLVETLYETALNIGRTVAGLSSAAAGATARMGPLDFMRASPGAIGANLEAVLALIRGEDEDAVALRWGERLESLGFDMNEAIKAQEEGERPWQQRLDEFRALLLELEGAGKKPKDQYFSGGEGPPDEPGRQIAHVRDHGDELIRVGNFLGSSKDALESIAHRQVELLQQIVDNTRPRPYAADVNVSDDDFPLV